MRYIIFVVLIFFSNSVLANNCVRSEEYSAHYMGYLAVSESYPDPVLMWWRGDNEEDWETNRGGKFVGVLKLSTKMIYQEARQILKKKRADMYFVAWPDTLKLPDRTIEVIKVSFAQSKDLAAYNVAFETVFKPSEYNADEKKATAVAFELGCATNLLQ